MMRARAPGLYFIGEAVDVTGWLGGYNFQWAWASGDATGQRPRFAPEGLPAPYLCDKGSAILRNL